MAPTPQPLLHPTNAMAPTTQPHLPPPIYPSSPCPLAPNPFGPHLPQRHGHLPAVRRHTGRPGSEPDAEAVSVEAGAAGKLGGSRPAVCHHNPGTPLR